MYVETWDGLYAPIGLRKPEGDGPFPTILLASGNGGEGMRWIRDAVRNRGYTMDRLVDAGYACAWLRYRTEVELGYNNGGKLVRDMRQGREMFNRSPLEYEDEIAIIEHVKTLTYVDPDRIGLDRDEPRRRDGAKDHLRIPRRPGGGRQRAREPRVPCAHP